jgi:low affinity Fe/Cu permease
VSAWFDRLAAEVSRWAGSAWAFVLAAGLVLVWTIGGFWFGFTDTFYQLLINSTTTCITFLMVFLIQNTTNRSTDALQVKLDELLRANADARDELMDLEDRPTRDLDAAKADVRARRGDGD